LEQVHLALALEGLPVGHADAFSLQVFTGALGGGMSSRLFQEVREKRGLCYSIYAFHMPYSDTGVFGLYSGTDSTDAPELMKVVIDEIADATATLNESEVNRTKVQMKAGQLMALESSGARAEQIARQVLFYGRPLSLDEIVQKIDAVTVESVRAAGAAMLRRSRPAIAALGSGRGLASAAAIAETLGKQAA
jgi:predicted Zn-dependent peptidase